MSKLKGVIVCLFATVLLAACDLDLNGINALDDYANETAWNLQVSRVECPDSLLAGEVARCDAFNPLSTELKEAVLWSSAFPGIASVDLGGVITAKAPGTAVIRGHGALDSSASDTIVVH